LFFALPVEDKTKQTPKKKISSPETKDIVTSTGSNEKYHTKYEYTDSIGKSLIIQNSFPKGEKYTDPPAIAGLPKRSTPPK